MEVLKRDTFSASLVQQDKAVTGKITFDNFEKDGSSGMVNGYLENGIIKLSYSFQSEGMVSVMQVWFKKEGDLLIRGLGEMNVKNDSSYFTNPMAVRFEGSKLHSIDCKNLPAKYKTVCLAFLFCLSLCLCMVSYNSPAN